MVVLRKRTRPQRALSAARAGGTSLRHRRALWRSAPPSHISPTSRTCDVCGAKSPQKYKQTGKNTKKAPTHILNTAFTNTKYEERAGRISRGALVSLLFKDSAACSDPRRLRETWRNPKYQIPNTLQNNSQIETNTGCIQNSN